MKKIIKISVLLVICLTLTAICVYAFGPGDLNGGTVDVGKLEKLGGVIVGAIQAIGVIVAVSVLIYMGIRLMMASPAEKANIKGMMVPYIVGAIIIFATTSLVNILYQLSKGITA